MDDFCCFVLGFAIDELPIGTTVLLKFCVGDADEVVGRLTAFVASSSKTFLMSYSMTRLLASNRARNPVGSK